MSALFIDRTHPLRLAVFQTDPGSTFHLTLLSRHLSVNTEPEISALPQTHVRAQSSHLSTHHLIRISLSSAKCLFNGQQRWK